MAVAAGAASMSARVREEVLQDPRACQDCVFINGEWHVCEGSFPVRDPSTGDVLCHVPEATAEQVDAAVHAAHNALHEWGRVMKGRERAAILRSVARSLRTRRDAFARKEAVNAGKPIAEAKWDIDDVVTAFEYHARLAEELDERQWTPRSVGDDDVQASICYEPMGVVGAIVPFNYPLLMMSWKASAALAAGCTVVLKPSEYTPLTTLDFCVVLEEAGVPPGVINIVTGYGATTGAAIVQHPMVDKLTFTGSVPTGKFIMGEAATQLKNVSLELGGKSSAIVFESAQIPRAVDWVMFGCFWTNGQICSATSRLLLHESIADEFLGRLETTARTIRCGLPLDPETKMGPVISEQQYIKVMAFLERAKAEGARALVGGGRPENVPEGGYFVAPTVLVDIDPSMEIWNEEVFGPVLSVMTFSTEEEAIRRANDCQYGLAAAVFSTDTDQLRRVTRFLDTGIVWQNCSQPCYVQLPWGGTKQSGVGRDLGEEGFEEYLQPKQVVDWVKDGCLDWYAPVSKL